jgi:hypothetical protein
MMTPQLQAAVRAAQDRKALDLSVLDLERSLLFHRLFSDLLRHFRAACAGDLRRD